MNHFQNMNFDIIVISLRTSVERRVRASRQLDAMPFVWSFQDAVHGASLPSLPDEYDRKKHLHLLGFDMIPGQIGCFLSRFNSRFPKCCLSYLKICRISMF